jgi:hypothetical protein
VCRRIKLCFIICSVTQNINNERLVMTEGSFKGLTRIRIQFLNSSVKVDIAFNFNVRMKFNIFLSKEKYTSFHFVIFRKVRLRINDRLRQQATTSEVVRKLKRKKEKKEKKKKRKKEIEIEIALSGIVLTVGVGVAISEQVLLLKNNGIQI